MAEVTPIRWDGDALELLDQRRLPHEVVWIRCDSPRDVASAIQDMVVRGAPAIGVCAAYGIAMATSGPRGLGTGAESRPVSADLEEVLQHAAEILRASRPTAVNLGWAIDRMLRVFRESGLTDAAAVRERLLGEAREIFDEDVAANRRIGRFGAELLGQNATVLTHCNAGALATAGYGTALGVIRAAHEGGKKVAVFADETRPYLQGSRLTAWELQQEGIDVTLITDNMAGHFFREGKIDAVIVGADRIAANGDTANKIGTYILAVLAQAHGVPFYIAAPVSTIDFACAEGSMIPIEERSGDEVTMTGGWDEGGTFRRVSTAPRGIKVRHPAFDVTPAALITAIITDRGVLRQPYLSSIAAIRSSDRREFSP